jgi:hypothetical protein
MIYSKWRADVGGYDLFEVKGERRALGNDMPIPSLVASSPIGIASVECGRKVPAGASGAGQSAMPVGSVTPTKAGSLMGVGISDVPGGWSGVFMLAVGVALGFIGAPHLKSWWRS